MTAEFKFKVCASVEVCALETKEPQIFQKFAALKSVIGFIPTGAVILILHWILRREVKHNMLEFIVIYIVYYHLWGKNGYDNS